MVAFASFLDQHAGVLAFAALIIAWLLYRFDRWRQRSGVLHGLAVELNMHGRWVGNPYNEADRASWPDPDYLVFKLVTVATDDAIARGPALFLNPDLSPALINYRQVIGHFNQLIDKQMDFQANVDLYRPDRAQYLVTAAVQMTESIHIQGIGDASLQHPPAAFLFYRQVVARLERERRLRIVAALWFVTGLNLYPLRRALRPLMTIARRIWALSRKGLRLFTDQPEANRELPQTAVANISVASTSDHTQPTEHIA